MKLLQKIFKRVVAGPTDLNECLNELKNFLSREDIEAVKAMDENDTYMLHFGLGMHLRNKWGLWSGSNLQKYFNSIGISHPDDMTAIVFKSFWRALNNRPLDVEGQVKECQEYWKRINVKVV
jgi:hypothetical protein